MSGSSGSLNSLKSPLLQPLASGKDLGLQGPMLRSFVDLCPYVVHDTCGLRSNLNNNDYKIIQNPTEEDLIWREFSLIDDNFVNKLDQKVENFARPIIEKSDVKYCSLVETKPLWKLCMRLLMLACSLHQSCPMHIG